MSTKCKHFLITAGCAHCHALQKEWYGKLAEHSFIDAENSSMASRPLEVWHSNKFQRINISKRLFTESYYDRAFELLHTFPFKNDTERRIWEFHCNGKSKRKIESLIQNMEKPLKREAIGNIINKIAREIK